jgi:hypothetical protein
MPYPLSCIIPINYDGVVKTLHLLCSKRALQYLHEQSINTGIDK